MGSQTYPHIEHLVVDGGSRDATAAIVASSPGTRLIVAPGLEQAAAVNRGVAEARGEIVVVLNADDTLVDTAIARLVDALTADPEAVAAYGDAVHIGEDGTVLGAYPTQPFRAGDLLESCYICQPASAVRREAFLAVGGLDPRLDVVHDYDFWIRLSRRARFRKVDAVLAAARMHRENKTLARRGEVYREAVRILRAHFGYVPYTWTFGYASWLLERSDQFFTPARGSRAAVLLSLALGLGLNPRQPLRYVRDWYGHRTRGRRR